MSVIFYDHTTGREIELSDSDPGWTTVEWDADGIFRIYLDEEEVAKQ